MLQRRSSEQSWVLTTLRRSFVSNNTITTGQGLFYHRSSHLGECILNHFPELGFQLRSLEPKTKNGPS